MKTVENIKNLRGQKETELLKALKSEYEKLAKDTMAVHSKKAKDFSIIKKSRRQIARMLTIIGQKTRENNDK